MWIPLIILALIIVYLMYEFRLKKPDQIVLSEKAGMIVQRKSKYYPRHFSITIPRKSHSVQLNFETSTKGRLDIVVKLIVTAVASLENLSLLIQVGGWEKNTIANAAKEVEIVLLGLIREFTEKFDIEELSGEKLSEYLKSRTKEIPGTFGIEIISISIQSIDPIDKKIAEAMRKKETARILEQTEIENQKLRVAAAQSKVQADEQIVFSEHELELKKLALRKKEEEKEAELAQLRVEAEMKRKKIQLSLDKEEISMLKNNPELLLLTPQVAKLAEASQSLKNARTVVSLSPNETDQGFNLIGTIHTIFQNILDNSVKKLNNRDEKRIE